MKKDIPNTIKPKKATECFIGFRLNLGKSSEIIIIITSDHSSYEQHIWGRLCHYLKIARAENQTTIAKLSLSKSLIHTVSWDFFLWERRRGHKKRLCLIQKKYPSKIKVETKTFEFGLRCDITLVAWEY